jgi:hypothetical protein
MPMSTMHANAMPATGRPKGFPARLRVAVADEVLTDRETVCAAALLMVTDAGILHVAGSVAAVGVIAQRRLIAPVNPADGVKVIVEVFPVAAPGTTLSGVPVIENPGDSNE